MRHIAGISTATLESVFCGCWFIVIDETAKDENICNGVSLESSPEAQQEISPEIQYNQAGTGITTDGQEYGYTYDLAGRVAGSDTVQGTAGGYMRTYSRYVYEDKTNRLSEYNVRMPKSG
ncbi:MAG: hypothetical protein GX051_10795, partial [Clostridiales bacterium]|nr:hypothetical protein [Clostridiales bacterium]